MADKSIKDAVYELLANPMDLPPAFWQYATQSWLKDAPVFPISQVFGFTQFVGAPAPFVVTSETTTSGTYVDLATTGPVLTNLPDGKYLILFGAAISVTAGATSTFMSLSVNGSTPSNDDAIYTTSTAFVTLASARTKALTNNGSNTVKAQYAADGVRTATFLNRWLIALKYGNN